MGYLFATLIEHIQLWDDCKHRVADGCFKDHEEEITTINRFKRFKNRPPEIP